MNEVLTLFELNSLVRDVIEENFDEQYWVTGELSDVSTPAFGGHFYGELVQKDEESDRIVARARITCWARNYNMIRLRFQKEAGETLRKGLQVKLLVEINFHEQYGYSLNVVDIDSTFTLGDLAKRRREILQQLEKDGILHDNQSLPLPRLLKRIAVISSATAAGYGDFCHQLEQNDYGFHFDVRLFPAVMQGEQVPESIIVALEEVQNADHFDLVVIIRGGGASSDLSDFDSYELAACIALYPLPVLTGIGHERDETVLDYVAHTRVKTPTAAATFIIEHQAEEAALLDDLYQRITHSAKEKILREKQRLEHQRAVLPLLFTNLIQDKQSSLRLLRQRLLTAIPQQIEREHHRQELLKKRLEILDPKLLLRRGYTITTCGGRLVRCIDDLAEGDVLTTQTDKGEILSKVLVFKINNIKIQSTPPRGSVEGAIWKNQ
ncbi:MAG: exodeoxyribonuclease VII large subunit [Bacteroidaceae bacterium]|nr:exodeoxyribonuclease VII large subunit [Bacteroidaceae bacterium]